ncbi:carboxylesterase [Anopheles darlingi]|uniref:Carboxylesterase n=1 Tax=Anopheles darlingi TaxID=43151 RepID=W5J5B7_ANODA|nr:carboxylesterase [Anopheles darlingi]
MEYIRKLHKYKSFHFVASDPESGNADIVEYIENFLRLIGVSIFKRKWNFFNFVFVVGMTMFPLYMMCVCYTCFLYRHDTSKLIFCITTLGFNFQALVKIFFFTIRRRRVLTLNDFSARHYRCVKRESDRVQDVICKNLSLIFVIFKGTFYVYQMLMITALILPAVVSFFLEDLILPFGFILPFANPEETTGYVVNYIFQTIISYYYYGISAGSDIAIIYNLLTASGQLDCLMALVEELNDQLAQGIAPTAIRRKILQIIQLHQFHREYLKKLTKFLYLYHVGAIGSTIFSIIISVLGFTDELIATVGAIKWDRLTSVEMKNMNLVLTITQNPILLMLPAATFVCQWGIVFFPVAGAPKQHHRPFLAGKFLRLSQNRYAHLLLVAVTMGADEESSPIVSLPVLGALRGSTSAGAWTGRKIYQFLGVHYAQPTGGGNRFKPPQKVLPWQGVKDATRHGLPCPQLKQISLFTGKAFAPDPEDCLTVSIYSTDLAGRKPVMAFVHGGGFHEGCAKNQTAEYLLERDVVLVTVQYRLGPLGFLSTGTENIPGNMGLMDLRLALEWVQEYIERFGGDPGSVTLFGQSAGAAAISALIYSPQVPEGLFHRVILQSAGSSSPWVWDTQPSASALEIAIRAGCEPNATLEEAERFLATVDIWTLLRSFFDLKVEKTVAKGLDHVGGNRLVAGDFHGFLPKSPWECMQEGKFRKPLAMMAGVTKHEGTFLLTTVYDHFKRTGQLDDPNFVRYHLVDAVNKFLGAHDATGALGGYEMRTLFTGRELSSGSFAELADGLTDLAGTILIKAPLLREAQANARANPNATYLYTFDYVGEKSRFGYGADTSHYPFGGGVHHSDDKLYLFPYPAEKPGQLNEKDTAMAKLMVDLWTSFATGGVPMSDRLTEKWNPMSEYAGPYLHIDNRLSIGWNYYEEFTVASDEKHRRSKESSV